MRVSGRLTREWRRITDAADRLFAREAFVTLIETEIGQIKQGLLQYEMIFWLRQQGFLFCEDYVWGKPSPPPGRFNRFLKDAVEYCFQFAKTSDWQFFPEHCLTPARWDARDRERRKKLAHNYV